MVRSKALGDGATNNDNIPSNSSKQNDGLTVMLAESKLSTTVSQICDLPGGAPGGVSDRGRVPDIWTRAGEMRVA